MPSTIASTYSLTTFINTTDYQLIPYASRAPLNTDHMTPPLEHVFKYFFKYMQSDLAHWYYRKTALDLNGVHIDYDHF